MDVVCVIFIVIVVYCSSLWNMKQTISEENVAKRKMVEETFCIFRFEQKFPGVFWLCSACFVCV